jgi:hypothetical protein
MAKEFGEFTNFVSVYVLCNVRLKLSAKPLIKENKINVCTNVNI